MASEKPTIADEILADENKQPSQPEDQIDWHQRHVDSEKAKFAHRHYTPRPSA